MTNAVKPDNVVEGNGLSGFPGSVPNPHVKSSDWGWQIDQMVKICVKHYMNVIKAFIYCRKWFGAIDTLKRMVQLMMIIVLIT